jgi:hypothetical protein
MDNQPLNPIQNNENEIIKIFKIRYGVRNGRPDDRYCKFANSRDSTRNWSASDLTTYFDPLWKLIGQAKLKSKWNVTGNLLRGHKCLIIVLFKQLLIILKQNNYWNANYTVEDIDFEEIMKPAIFTTIGSFVSEWLKSNIFLEFVKESFIDIPTRSEDVEDNLISNLEFIRHHTLRFCTYNDNLSLIRQIADQPPVENPVNENENQVIPPPPENPIIDNPHPEYNLESCYKCAYELMRKYASRYAYISVAETAVAAPVKFVDVWVKDLVDERKEKLLLLTMLLPYVRCNKYYPSFDLYMYKPLVDIVDIKRWFGSNTGYIQSVTGIKNQRLEWIQQQNYRSIYDDIKSLPNRWGFYYGGKLLSLEEDFYLRQTFNRKWGGYNVYKIADLREEYADIMGLTSAPAKLPKDVIVDDIAENNPHTIKNAITAYTDENLMDTDRNVFIKLKWPQGDVGFDLTELIAMIYSSKGKNEHMGLIDMPEKGKIWTNQKELENIFTKLKTVSQAHASRNPSQNQHIKDCISGLTSMAKSTLSEIENKTFNTVQDVLQELNGSENILGNDIYSKYSFLYTTTPEDLEKSYWPLATLAYLCQKAEIDKLTRFKLLLKDINLLHLIGYLGWIMLSDNVSSHSADADDFKVTNTCKDLVEQYIIRIIYDKDISKKFCYYNNDVEYHKNFDKKAIIETLKKLSFNNVKLESLLNPNDPTTCLHGIGGNLIMIYLKTLHELNDAIDRDIIKRDELPSYLSIQKLKPLSIFKHIGEGNYVYAVKNISNEVPDPLFADKPHYDNLSFNTERIRHKYSLQYLNVNSSIRRWCGHYIIPIKNSEILEQKYGNKLDEYVKHIIYDVGQYNQDYDTPFQVSNFFQYMSLPLQQLLYATDLFMSNRIQHFTIYVRYVIDFSNILHEYYNNDLLNENGKYDDKENSRFDYTYFDDNNQADTKDPKQFLYSRLNYFALDHDDSIEEFKKRFNYHLDINSAVARDYSKDDVNQKISELVYFHDILGKTSEIYDPDIVSGTKSVFGMIELLNGNKIGDEVINLIKSKPTESELKSSNITDFNKLVINKAMISKVLLKIMNPNIVNPFFMHIMDEDEHGGIDASAFAVAKRSVVSKFLTYINFNAFDITNSDNVLNAKLKYYKIIITYMFIYSIIQKMYLPEFVWSDQTYRSVINKQWFEIDGVITDAFDDFNNIDDVQELRVEIKRIKDRLYNDLWRFLNMFYDDRIPATYRYNILNISALRPLLLKVNTIINNPKEEVQNNIVKHLNELELDVYTKTSFEILPKDGDNTKTEINDSDYFISELVDIGYKYDLLERFLIPLEGLEVIFSKISEITELPTIDLANEDEWYFEILDKLASTNNNIHAVINDDIIKEKIGMNEETADAKIEKLFKSLIIANMNRFEIDDQNTVSKMKYIVVAICMCAYEHLNIYTEKSAQAQPQAQPEVPPQVQEIQPPPPVVPEPQQDEVEHRPRRRPALINIPDIPPELNNIPGIQEEMNALNGAVGELQDLMNDFFEEGEAVPDEILLRLIE